MSTAGRTLLHVAIGCTLLAIVADTWLVSGVLAPLVVASGSMAPGLRGPHRAWTCAQCKRVFVCGLDSLPTAGHSAKCPHCNAANRPDAGEDRAGNRVLVDRSAFAWRLPRRWEAVVLESPDVPGGLCVKRVVGLPGETIEVRDGDVLVDSQIVRKTLSEFRETAVLIDDDCAGQDRPRSTSPWQDPSGYWRRDGDGFVHSNVDSIPQRSTDSIDWLTYRHRAQLSATGDLSDGSILDESSYDQAESRVLNPVGDLVVRFQVAGDNAGRIGFRYRSDVSTYVAVVDVVSGDGTLRHNDAVVATFSAGSVPFSRPVTIDWVFADRQLQLAVENRVLVKHAFVPTNNGSAAAARVAIGASGGRIAIRGLQVWRDVYYTAGAQSCGGTRYRLGFDEYFVLGDNSPHSRDSRWWEPWGVSGGAILGRALWW